MTTSFINYVNSPCIKIHKSYQYQCNRLQKLTYLEKIKPSQVRTASSYCKIKPFLYSSALKPGHVKLRQEVDSSQSDPFSIPTRSFTACLLPAQESPQNSACDLIAPFLIGTPLSLMGPQSHAPCHTSNVLHLEMNSLWNRGEWISETCLSPQLLQIRRHVPTHFLHVE